MKGSAIKDGMKEDLVSLNLAIRNQIKRYLARESWTPIMASLLLSGIRPSSHWTDVPGLDAREDHVPVSFCDIFARLQQTGRGWEIGLDGERVLVTTDRFKNAEIILRFLDQAFANSKVYPRDLYPVVDFTLWMQDMRERGEVHIPDLFWLNVFVDTCGATQASRVIPSEVLNWLAKSGGKDSGLILKHKFRAHIVKARAEAIEEGALEDDPDEILKRLAAMMKTGDVEGVKLYTNYKHGSDIVYREGKDILTLRRDSFARQLRRMNSRNEVLRRKPDEPLPKTGFFKLIERVEVKPDSISSFTSVGDTLELALRLLREATHYVWLTTLQSVPEVGWSRGQAALGGNMVRLSKLLLTLENMAKLKLVDPVLLLLPIVIEAMVSSKYMIAQFGPDVIDRYIRGSWPAGLAADEHNPNFDLRTMAEATGWKAVDIDYLEESLREHVHGSWQGVSKYHLHDIGDERYRPDMQLGGNNSDRHISPASLIYVCIEAVDIAREFAVAINTSATESLVYRACTDLLDRLKVVGEQVTRALSSHM
jgi:hypothetical protein